MDNSFLQIVTDNLIRKANGITELGKYTLVFPMQRAGLFVKQYLSQVLQQSAQPKPITLPRMTTIDSLTDSLCPMQNEDEISAICRLYQIYKKHTSHSLPIDAFYGWGLQLLNDFSSVAMASVKGDDIMRCTAEINRYENSGIDDETRERLEKLLAIEGNKDSIHDYFASLWENLPAIYHEFRESQEQQNLGSQGDRTQWVIQHWNDDCIQTKIKDRQYAFIGFNYLLTAEWQLMKLFHDNGQALFYWDDDPSFELDGNVYKYIHENIRHFPNALDCPAEEKRKVPQTTVVACQSDAAQAQFVHDWLEQTQANSAPGDKTAIVIAKESLLQQVVYALP
ncbi:MAG: hypothetical protein MJZ75_07375, partial [Paludibacteraceae bacterium]|nr:hypothetical protein [Paludibacteraceae bacterium]